MSKYIVIEIRNLEPLKIGSRGVQNQMENSKSHIPGSTIRGAVIYYISKQLKLDKNLCIQGSNKYKRQLLEDMKCYNAYPVYDKKLFFPSPIHLRTNKHKFREASINKKDDFKEFKSLLDGTDYINNLPLTYISIDKSVKGQSKIKAIDIKKELRLHHNKSQNKENLFRYEAIKKGHIFRTIISASPEILVAIGESLKNNNKWYLGGSKGSGYGLCEIKELSMCDKYDEAKSQIGLEIEHNEGKELVITCLSDCILRDDDGNPCNHIEISELESIVGKRNFRLERVIVNQGYSEGYNMKWGFRYPKESTVKAGSIIKYTCDDLSEKDLRKLQENLYGMRTTDGYGWIAVNVKYPNKIDLNTIAGNQNHRDDDESKADNNTHLNDNSFKIIVDGLENAKEKWLRYILVREAAKNLIRIDNINNNRRQNMRMILKKMEASDVFLTRGDLNNSKKFSINESTFKDIYDYLKGEENLRLDEYISHKLSTTKGRLFYKDANKKKFLEDLTILSLKVGGEIYEQNNEI